LTDPGQANPNIFDPVESVAMRARNQHNALGHISFTAGYRKGGVVPGPEGKPVWARAEAGERILSILERKSWDKLSRTISEWSRHSSAKGIRSPNLEDGKRDSEQLRRVEKILERQYKKMLSKEEQRDNFIKGAFAAQVSDLAGEILDERLDAAVGRLEQVIGA
jgi:hypothetical protein